MDRARRAEPYSNATIWTREIARNLAGHLARISKAHSYVDTGHGAKTRVLPKVQATKRCATSPVKTRQQQPPSLQIVVSGAENDELESERVEECDGDNNLDTRLGGSRAHALLVCTPQLEDFRSNSECAVDPSQAPRRSVHHNVRKKQARQHGSKKAKIEVDRLEAIAHENHRLHTRLAKIATPHEKPSQHPRSPALSSGLHSVDTAAMREHLEQSKAAHDYNKKQGQLKIWTENQALAKRLRTAKTTLKPKEWEKDERWNQHFLRSQEKRRIALQQELLRATMTPQAVLARANKLSQLQDTRRSSRTGSTSPSARSGSRPTESLESIDKAGNDDLDGASRATAANHRRIMMLRNQRSAPTPERHHTSSHPSFGNQFESDPHVVESDSDVVSVRFTFSRERSRGRLASSECDLDPERLMIESPVACCDGKNDNDDTHAFGAFPPATELECALDAIDMEAPATLEDQPAVVIEEVVVTQETLFVQGSGFADEEINAVVFETLQALIDRVADELSSDGGMLQWGFEEQAEEARCLSLQEEHDEISKRKENAKAVETVVVELAGASSDTERDDPACSVGSEVGPATVVVFRAPDVCEKQADDVAVQVEVERMSALGDLTEATGSRIPSVDDASVDRDDKVWLRNDDGVEVAADNHLDRDENDTFVDAEESVTTRVLGDELDEPEYDEEHFDDDAVPSGDDEDVFAVPAAAPHSESKSAVAVAGDDDSGYGSEFDDEQERQERQNNVDREASDNPRASENTNVHGDEEDDDDYDYYDDVEDHGSESNELASGYRLPQPQEIGEDASSYSDDDDFSDPDQE